MSAMLDALGQWIGRQSRRPRLAPAELAKYAPCRTLSEDELKTALRQLERHPTPIGLIGTELAADRRWFLEHGSLQVQTRTGFVLTLQAGSPQSRYPIPLPPQVVSLYAAESGSLLGVPLAALRHPGHERSAIRPVLTDSEQQALEGLRTSFAKGHCELPSLPDLAHKIGRAIDDQSNKNKEIARLIQLDPALTARLLSIVNSAAFGGVKKISGINQATNRLGRTRVRSLVYSCLLRSIFRINSASLERRMQTIWQRSAHVAALSFVLGRETPGIDAEQAMLAGLTHDIGSVAVIGSLNRFPALTKRAEVLDYAIELLRVDAGLRSVRQWNLYSDLEDVIREAGNWQRFGSAIPETADVVNLALLHALIGDRQRRDLPRIDSIPAFSKLARGKLTPDHSLHLLDEAEAEVREVYSLLSNG